ncbi:glycosidase [Streptomyces umbrinus]|uniref:Glycosidase n=1 Tax=Streptomyces umbrinus TaxID=67370 RepID=A0ABU0T9M7_9ACTN|nr:alpha-amylase family glycosyl hydrolase [Streptomyces umbrinus]MDQ1032511.1 glycosidase [Streptomyces umbrinus]
MDGFRMDVAHDLVKDPELPDLAGHDGSVHPFWDRDEVHDIYRAWRKVADEHPGDRAFVAEAWTDTPERLAAHLRPDGLHIAFNFGYLMASWDAKDLRAVIDDTFAMPGTVGAPATWVMSNHDVMRHAGRCGRKAARKGVANESYVPAGPADLELGTRRARAAALLTLAFPGGTYIYQGEEPRPGRGRGPVRGGSSRIPSGSVRAIPSGAATAAVSRSPGPGGRRRTASAPRTPSPRPGCPSPPAGCRARWRP